MTVREEITPSQEPFRSLVDVDLLREAADLGATHVLVGIDWGAMGTIICEDENKDDEETTKVKGALEAELTKWKKVLNAGVSAGTDYEDENNSTDRKFTYYSKFDVFDRDSDLAMNFGEAVEQARKLPANLAKYNNGKGVPVTFSLMSIERLTKRLKIEGSGSVVFRFLPEDSVQRCAQAVEFATELKQKIYDLRTELKDSNDVLTHVDQMYEGLSVREKTFKEDLQRALKKARSHEVDIAEVDTVVDSYEIELEKVSVPYVMFCQ